MNILIRTAIPTDLPILREFEQGVISAERPFDTTLGSDPIHYYDLEFMLSAPDIHLVGAESNGELIGSGYARIEEAKHYLQHSHHAYLGFMYTIPAYRGKGVNSKIIDALSAWSKTRQITEMRLDVYYHNTAAIRAYEKKGFVNYMIAMRSAVE